MRRRHVADGGRIGRAFAVKVVGPFAAGEGPFAAEVAGSVDCAGGVSLVEA